MTRGFGFALLTLGILASVVGGIGTAIAIGQMNRGGPGMLIPFILLDAFGVTCLILAVVVLNRAATKQKATVATGGPGRYVPNTGVVHELDNTPYMVVYTPPVKGKHAKPSVLTFSTECACKGEFQMTVETWFDKMCKRLGIATEVQTGDEKFDDECYIRSDTPEFTAAYLTDPVKRIAILDLRRFNFKDVSLTDGKLTAKWTGFNPDTDDRPDLNADVAARLLILARNLPAEQPEFAHRTGAHRKLGQFVLWTGLILFALTAIGIAAFPPVETGELLFRAAAVLLAWPLFAYISAYLLSGTSRSHNAWGALMLGSLLLFPPGCAGTIGLLNGLLDSSPEVAHDALITDKYTTRSKNKTNYNVRVASWRDPGETVSFRVSSSEYGTVAPGRSQMHVVTRAGWLGVEWIKSKRVVSKPKP
jgi:hypothetical protein